MIAVSIVTNVHNIINNLLTLSTVQAKWRLLTRVPLICLSGAPANLHLNNPVCYNTTKSLVTLLSRTTIVIL